MPQNLLKVFLEFLNKFKNPIFLLKIFAIAFVYYIFSKIGLSFASEVKQVTLVWPSTGIAIASLLLFGEELWPGILIGAFFANVTTFETSLIALFIAIGNTLEATVSCFLLTKFNFDKRFHHVKDILKYILCASIVSTTVSATIGTASLALGGLLISKNILFTWTTWWLGDATGAMIFGPLILSWSNYKYLNFTFNRILKAIIFIASSTLISALVFTGFISPLFVKYPTRYFIFPFLIWGSMDFGVPGATWITLIITTVSVAGYRLQGSPFVFGQNDIFGLVILQLSNAVFGITALVLAAMTEESKRFEEDLELINNDLYKYRLAVENASDHIIITDDNAHILYANKAATEITGYSLQEMLGKTPALWGKKMPKTYYEKMWKTIKEDKKTFKSEITNRRKNGEDYPATIAISPVVEKGKVSYFVGVEQDVSKERAVDRMRSEFVSLTSHQLRSPLTIIKWSIEAFEKDLPKNLSDNQKKLIKNVYDSNQLMIDMVNALLDVSRLEMGRMKVEPKLTNLEHLVKEAAAQVEEFRKEKNIHLSIKTKGKVPDINTDPDLTLNVFLSLINNAIKYADKNGHISVVLRKDKNLIIVDIEDDGIGIPQPDQKHIFERFFRASNVVGAGGGTGLGLYLAKQIAEALDGKIWFKSTEGKGSTFSFSLPLSGSKANEGEVRIGARSTR